MAAYEWAISGIYKVDAKAAKEEIDRISEKHGGINAKEIVDESRPEDSVLHGCFEWDDGIAAEKYREDQANRIVRSIRIVSETGNTTESVRAYVNVKEEYRPLSVVLKSEEMTQSLLENALAELKAFQRKYSTLSRLAPVFSAIEGVLKESAKE